LDTTGTPHLIIAAPITLGVFGGGGADDLFVSFAPEPPSDRPGGGSMVIVNAPLSFNVQGEGGDDTIDVRARNLVRAADPAIGNPDFLVAINGGGGDDLIDVEWTDPAGDSYGASRPNLSLMADGGKGNDRIHILAGTTGGATDPDLLLNWNI